MTKIKLDENLGRSAVEVLRRAGYGAERLYEERLSGASDKEIWDFICLNHRFFITLDLDFSDVRRFKPGTHPGILILRLSDQSRDAVRYVLSRVIKEYPLDTLRGCLIVANESRTRIRRPKSST